MTTTTLTDEIRTLLDTMYASYLRGDAATTDLLLLDDVTMFDSAGGSLVDGLGELAELRLRRAAARADQSVPQLTETALTASAVTGREVGGVIVGTWELRIDAVDADGRAVAPELARNTAVFVRRDGALRIAHIHEDVTEDFGAPVA